MINNGFTLDGISAKELNIIMTKDSKRPIAPSTQGRFLSIPGQNGTKYFGADLTALHFDLDCRLIRKDYIELQQAIERFKAVILDGYGKPKVMKLVFDVSPDRFFNVVYNGSLDVDRLYGLGSFTLPLTVIGEPFARSIDDSNTITTWGSSVTWDSSILWGDTWQFEVTENTTIEVNNWGTMIVKPTIIIEGYCDEFSLTCNNKTFTYNNNLDDETLTINCERLTVRKGNENTLKHMQGVFIDLKAGNNEININGTNLSLNVKFEFKTMYF